jgi:lysophospholipase L1-like esterase
MTYLALGDSAAQGIGATSPERGYVGIIAKRYHANNPESSLAVVNLSRTGATMHDYLVEQAPKIKDIHADLVTIEIGANDIKGFVPEAFRADFKRVLASLPDGSYVSNMPLFNSRPGLTQPAKDASKIIAEELMAYPKLHFVDLQKQTSEHQSIFGFAPDIFHPNNLSYQNWANAFWNEISL